MMILWLKSLVFLRKIFFVSYTHIAAHSSPEVQFQKVRYFLLAFVGTKNIDSTFMSMQIKCSFIHIRYK